MCIFRAVRMKGHANMGKYFIILIVSISFASCVANRDLSVVRYDDEFYITSYDGEYDLMEPGTDISERMYTCGDGCISSTHFTISMPNQHYVGYRWSEAGAEFEVRDIRDGEITIYGVSEQTRFRYVISECGIPISIGRWSVGEEFIDNLVNSRLDLSPIC